MRIISGRFRGRDLGRVPPGVRPTTDRVRESLFAVLGSVAETRVLDLFAGTGALGLEALSRGASFVTFVEKSRKVLLSLNKRVAELGLEDSDECEILGMAADAALRRLAREDQSAFDLVFVDPPYAALEKTTVLDTLIETKLLSPTATVVVEGPKRHSLAPPLGLRISDERIYGDTQLTWLRIAASAPSEHRSFEKGEQA